MERRKVIAFINVLLFTLFMIAFFFKMLILAAILQIIFAAVFVFTVQS